FSMGDRSAPLHTLKACRRTGHDALDQSSTVRCCASSAGFARAIDSGGEASEGGRSPPPSSARSRETNRRGNAMPNFETTPGVALHYRVDDFTDPWTDPKTILLLHGNAESGLAWYGWVPLLARRFRVVRPDMRGYGASTPMPRNFPWSLDLIIDDYARLMDSLGVQRSPLVGAKIAGIIPPPLPPPRP